jgi:NTE family protein
MVMGSKKTVKKKIALALGAGGARGLAHIGVINYLVKTGIKIDFVAGSSIGALIGALFCHQGDIDAVRQKVLDYLGDEELAKKWEGLVPRKDQNNKSKTGQIIEDLRTYIGKQYIKFAVITKKSLARRSDLMEPLEHLFGNMTAEDLKIPFSACAVDLLSGQELHLKNGRLVDIIYASAAIPGIFPPLERNGMLLADGSISDLVPIEAVPDQDEYFIIAVDFGPGAFLKGELEKGVDILMRSDELARIKLNKLILQSADFVISPEVDEYHWAEFSHYREIMELGHRAAEQAGQKLINALAEAEEIQLSWWQRVLKPIQGSVK